MDKELEEIRAELDRLMLKMQQEAHISWKYEWPLKRKVKWPIQQLIARRKKHNLRRWLRHAETHSDT